jgi:hypothetical protein
MTEEIRALYYAIAEVSGDQAVHSHVRDALNRVARYKS